MDINGDRPVLVSACLMGLCTRYDGKACPCEYIMTNDSLDDFIPVCPEQLGGFSTPREPAEITRGDGRNVLDDRARVLRRDGADVTTGFVRGAKQALHLARLYDISQAYLKEGSPSCGVKRIKRDGDDIAGCGVTAALLEREGVRIEGVS
jgi:uncharacterized protein YbbK (DUF523 family)